MKLEGALKMLESVRAMADDGEDSIDAETAALNIIHILVEFIGNEKIKEKVDEICF